MIKVVLFGVICVTAITCDHAMAEGPFVCNVNATDINQTSCPSLYDTPDTPSGRAQIPDELFRTQRHFHDGYPGPHLTATPMYNDDSLSFEMYKYNGGFVFDKFVIKGTNESEYMYSLPVMGKSYGFKDDGRMPFFIYEPVKTYLKNGYNIAMQTVQEYNALPLALVQNSIRLIITSFDDPNNVKLAKKYDDATFKAEASNFGNYKKDFYRTPTPSFTVPIVSWGQNGTPRAPPLGTLAHELAHAFDGNDNSVSNGAEYKDAIKADTVGDKIYLNDYDAEAARTYEGKDRQNSEDFADSVVLYVTNKDLLAKNFPHRAAYLTRIFDNFGTRRTNSPKVMWEWPT